MKQKNAKLSIIVSNYSNKKDFIDRSISSLLNQTYKNIEIIFVNNNSKDNSESIIKEYIDKDKRIKFINIKDNKGPFYSKLIGSDKATGDYITFLDVGDYVSIDYYRNSIDSAVSNDSDIVIGKTVFEYLDGSKKEKPLMNFNFKELNNSLILDSFFEQKGYNILWYTMCNKIYSIDVWRQARSHYEMIKDNLALYENLIFSTALFFYAKKITTIDNDCVFYFQDKDKTNQETINFETEKKYINDILIVLSFIESFLKEKKVFNKYKEDLLEWKKIIYTTHKNCITLIKDISEEEKNSLLDNLSKISKEGIKPEKLEFLSSISIDYDDRLNNIKKLIMDEDIKCVSFDIFDTLITRPFYVPSDLFRMLDPSFNKLAGKSSINFSKIRIESEKHIREKKYANPKLGEEVTLDEIYDVLHDVYSLDKDLLDRIKQLEIDSEIRFCKRRNSTYELYQLAKYLNKRIICTSDIYLPKEVINKILDKCGYDIKTIYLSSEIMKTKATGNLYEYVLLKEKLNSEEIIHIGDNYETDYNNSSKHGLKSIYYMKTIDAMCYAGNLAKMYTRSLPLWQDNACSMRFIGIRTMLAMVANKYFDNPYKSFDKSTDLNADPYLIGYYALGMYNFGITRWLLDKTNNKYDTLAFMSRDGYLSMKTYDILKSLYDKPAQSEYLYFSRKSSIPILIKEKFDFYRLIDVAYYANTNPLKISKLLESIIDISPEKLNKFCDDNNIKCDQNFKSITELNKFLTLFVDNFFNYENHSNTRNKLKNYFDKILKGKCAIFDVGYSGRPEYYLGKLLNRKVDAFFLNINSDEACEYQKMGNFELNTFFSVKPALTGNAYELLISKLGPSCIGYDTKEEVIPIFEKYEKNYLVEYVIKIIQNAALEFTNDLYNIFKEDIKLLYYQDYYLTLPIMAYFNSGQDLDRKVLKIIEFEDDIGRGLVRNMIDDMEIDAYSKNQRNINELLDKPIPEKETIYIKEPVVKLPKHKISRIVYYTLFDRSTLKDKIKNKKDRLLKRKNGSK